MYLLIPSSPYSTHVKSSDVISRYVDSETGELHTIRVHLKRGKLPATLTRFLPSISESYILETSVINPKTMVMKTETKNLDHTGILRVIESQEYTPDSSRPETTRVHTSVKFDSRFGNRRKDEDDEERRGVWGRVSDVSGWGKAGVQRTIEQLGVRKTGESLANGKKGMKLVLERFRQAGLSGVTAGPGVFMHAAGFQFGASDEGRWRRVWRGLRDEMAFDNEI